MTVVVERSPGLRPRSAGAALDHDPPHVGDLVASPLGGGILTAILVAPDGVFGTVAEVDDEWTDWVDWPLGDLTVVHRRARQASECRRPGCSTPVLEGGGYCAPHADQLESDAA